MSATTEGEKRAMRGTLGSLSWLCGQTCFLFSVDVNFFISKIPTSTVDDLLQLNKLVRDVQKTKHIRYKIHSFQPEDQLELISWTDAAHANRPDSVDSTEGIFIGMSTKRLRDGMEDNVTPVLWRSGKISRVCRSSASAEVQSSLDGEDDLAFLRIMWAELQGYNINLRDIDHAVSLTPAIMVTDAKDLHDKLNSTVLTIKGAEKRTSIEALSLKQHLTATQTPLRWVNGGAMLANVLTKPKEKHQGWLFVRMGFRWRITYDSTMVSEKKLRSRGQDCLLPTGARTETHTHHTCNKEGEEHKTCSDNQGDRPT